MNRRRPLTWVAGGPSPLTGDQPPLAAAPAKINLNLKITGRRPNGYHDLDTVMARLELADRLGFEFLADGALDRLQLMDPGQFDQAFPVARAILPSSLTHESAPSFQPDQSFTQNNLILKAAAAYRLRTGWPEAKVAVYLEKNIPVGAGLGGGSSDCAAVLRFLNDRSPHPLPDDELLDLGLSLGADVPFFLQPRPLAWATGVGEIFSDLPESWLPWAGKPLILVNPGLELSTAEVFKNWDLTNQPVNHNIALMIPAKPGDNDLLSAARHLVPAMAAIVAAIEELEPVAWGLSGSGPTFWLDSDQVDLERFQASHPQWWVRKTRVLGS